MLVTETALVESRQEASRMPQDKALRQLLRMVRKDHTSYEDSRNLSHDEISSHTCEDGHYQKDKRCIFCQVCEHSVYLQWVVNVNCFSYYGNCTGMPQARNMALLGLGWWLLIKCSLHRHKDMSLTPQNP